MVLGNHDSVSSGKVLFFVKSYSALLVTDFEFIKNNLLLTSIYWVSTMYVVLL